MKTKKKVLVMRKVLITGAGNGVGKATAEILKDEKLLLIDIDEKNLKAVAKKLNCDYFVCDVTNVENIESLKQYVEKHFSKIDTLINCAGVWTKGEISQLNNEHFKKLNTLEKLKNIIATNTFGTIAMITAFSPILINNAAVKRGVDSCQIININSQSGVETEEFCPVYNASKHGSYYYRKALIDLIKDQLIVIIIRFLHERLNSFLEISMISHRFTHDDQFIGLDPVHEKEFIFAVFCVKI